MYSLIQAQYDAALQNPPWEKTDNFDIDDRPKKKRRVTDRWFYEIVPSTGSAVPDTNNHFPKQTEPGSPRSQSSSRATASQDATGHDTPAARTQPISSPLSSPRSITPDLPSDFSIEDSSAPLAQTHSSTPVASSRSCSMQSQSSRSSSVFTADDISKETFSQSNSSAPSCSAKIDDTASATEPEPEQQFSSSPPSSTCGDTTKDGPQFSQPTSRALPNLKGRDLFDSMVWSDPFTTSIFYMFISSLREKIQNDVKSTTTTHKFIRTLRDGGRLVRNYTQNIDCLEEREHMCTDLTVGAGSKTRFQAKFLREPRPRFVERGSALCGGVECVLLHGSLVKLRCGICGTLCSWETDDRHSTTLSGSAPDCPSCTEHSARRQGRGRRGLAVGRLRPDIVLYGEEHPNASLIAPLITHDLSLGPDFLLIMGTSLKVHGLKIMVKEFAKSVHSKGGKVVFVNRTKPPESTWGEFIDYWVEWDCDEWVMDLQERREDIWLPQGSQMVLRRHSAGDVKTERNAKRPRAQNSRPQAVRDDKMSGVYQTFKILDSLRLIEDLSGAISTRRIYWEKTVRSIAPAKTELKKEVRKSLPASKPSAKEGNSKKRKSCQSNLPTRISSQDATEIWNRIRSFAPGLKPEPPEIGRVPLKDLHYNRDFPVHNLYMNYTRSFQDQSRNRFPWLDGLNLATHPPSGVGPPLHPPERIEKPVIHSPVVDHRPVTHSYGTRASRRSGLVQTAVPALHYEAPNGQTAIPVDDQARRPCSSSESNKATVDTAFDLTLPPERQSSLHSGAPDGDAPIAADDTSSPALPFSSASRDSTTNSVDKPINPSLPPAMPNGSTTIVVDTTTRPSHPSEISNKKTTILVDTSVYPSLPSTPTGEDTILVTAPSSQDGNPSTPPTSVDPMTPSSQRIKRMGSIGAILSSPEGSRSNESDRTVYYDAEEA